MLSRVAESLYWMSRYLERAENISRFMDENWLSALERFGKNPQNWRTTIDAMGDTELFLSIHDQPTMENVLYFLAFEERYPNSIRRCVQAARENARGICEIISQDLWYRINSFYHYVEKMARNAPSVMENPHGFLEEVKNYGLTFGGIVTDTMSHGDAWHFFRMGRMIERAEKTSRMLDVKYFVLLPRVEDVGTSIDVIQWAALLRSTNAHGAYLGRFGAITPAQVAEFLLFDREFPRAVRHCLEEVEQSIRFITRTPPGNYTNPAEIQAGRIMSDIAFDSIQPVILKGLHEYIDSLQIAINLLDRKIFESFFDH